jgi:hypothetical protein
MGYPTNGGTGATDYNGFYGVRFGITNPGASNQTIRMRFSRTDNVSGTNYSTSALTTQITAATWNNPNGAAVEHTWNNGSSAYPIPDAFWFRIPFAGRTIRVSSIAAVKIA